MYVSSVWRLNTTVFGLSDAARAWYFRLRSIFVELKVTILRLNNAVFLCYEDANLAGVVYIHVDDILWAGTQIFE